MTKYTVIIPAYNAERTLARCLDSLLSQGRSDVRILIINDGSRDGTERIALEYCEKSPLIEYHYQTNAGVSAARNAGLSLADGEFVSFADSDDYVMPGYFEVLDRIGSSDLLVFDRCHTGGTLRDDSEVFRRLSALERTEKKLELLMKSKKIMQPVNKCFRLELIRKYGLCFPDRIHIGEDFAFCMAYAVRCATIAVSREKAYCIDVSDGASLSRRYRPDLAEQLSKVAELVEQSILGSGSDRTESLLAHLDYLHTRNMLMCVAEEFKAQPWPRRSTVKHNCTRFASEYSPLRLGWQHRILRRLLKLRLYGFLTLLAWAARGKDYRHAAKEARYG